MSEEEEELPGEPEESDEATRGNRVLRFARRLMDRKELAEDTKELLYTVVSTSDKAKTEAVRMVAREVRTYLDELKLKDDLMHLMTSYSLEVSISLKPLADAVADVEPPKEEPESEEPGDDE